MLLLKKKNVGFIQLDFFVDQVSLDFNIYFKLILVIQIICFHFTIKLLHIQLYNTFFLTNMF